ncbi:MAG: XkdX family protein [Clostridium sp.]
MSFQTIELFYKVGLWNEAQIRELVGEGILTAEQYEEITGQAYLINNK